MDKLTEAARAEAMRYMIEEFAMFRDEVLGDAEDYGSEGELAGLTDELLHKHITVHATPRGRATAVLTLPGTVDLAHNVWIATVDAEEGRDAPVFTYGLVKLTDAEDVLRAALPAIRDYFVKRGGSDEYGPSLYLNAVLGTMTPSYIERVRRIAKKDGGADY